MYDITLVVDDERRVFFWKDKWCGPTVWCDEYPSLFSIAIYKDDLVLDVWSLGNNGGC